VSRRDEFARAIDLLTSSAWRQGFVHGQRGCLFDERRIDGGS
jgi:hypothetical protein